jgi:hypothetical protein
MKTLQPARFSPADASEIFVDLTVVSLWSAVGLALMALAYGFALVLKSRKRWLWLDSNPPRGEVISPATPARA